MPDAQTRHPSHVWNADDRCQHCGIGDWVSIALKPCTKAPVVATAAGDVPVGDGVDWFALIRSAG